MMRIVFGFIFIGIVLFSEIGSAVSIDRSRGGTKIIFKGDDLLHLHDSDFSKDGWLIKDSGYRQGCYLQTIAFETPFQVEGEAIVHFEALWRSGIDEIDEITEIELARIDLAYEKTNGKLHRDSEYLTIANLDSVNWIGKSLDFIYASAKTYATQPFHIKAISIPKASKNIRIKICGIAPRTTLKIEKVEIILAGFSDYIEASLPLVEDSQFKCFDTGLFLTNCRLGETVLDEPGNLEMEYAVELNFECQGHEVDFALVTDSNSMTLKPNIGKVNIRGRGLKLIDRSPAKTRIATFNPGCALSIGNIEKMVSQEQVNALHEKKAALEIDLANARQASRAFVDITLLARLIESLKESLELTSRSHRALGAAINDVTLQELLSPLQMKTLADMLETRNIIESSDDQYDHFKKLESIALKKLREIGCMTQSLKENGRCDEVSI